MSESQRTEIVPLEPVEPVPTDETPEPTTALEPTRQALEITAEPPSDPRADPFPREAWSTLLSHAAGYLRLTLALLKDPAVSRHRRAALLAAAAYFASPIDLVPGIIPVLGQLDDLAIAMLAIRLALNALEPSRRQAHLAAAGLSDDTLREDLAAAGALGAWSARAGARTGLRIGRATLAVTARGGRAAAGQLARGGRAASKRLSRRGRGQGPPASDALDDRVEATETDLARTPEAADPAPRSTVLRAGDLASGALSSAAGQVGRLGSGGVDRAGAAGRRLAARIRRRATDPSDSASSEPDDAPPEGPSDPS